MYTRQRHSDVLLDGTEEWSLRVRILEDLGTSLSIRTVGLVDPAAEGLTNVSLNSVPSHLNRLSLIPTLLTPSLFSAQTV